MDHEMFCVKANYLKLSLIIMSGKINLETSFDNILRYL